MGSIYAQSIPVMIKQFKSVSKILTKAVAYADEKGIKHDELLSFRLKEDMRPLPFQIQSMSNTAKFLLVRVFQLPHPAIEDTETTFAELQTRITDTITMLEAVNEQEIDAKKIAEEPVIMGSKIGDFRFESGQAYLSEFAIPNVHFHMATAYCILRHLGAPIGAMDYLGDVFHKV